MADNNGHCRTRPKHDALHRACSRNRCNLQITANNTSSLFHPGPLAADWPGRAVNQRLGGEDPVASRWRPEISLRRLARVAAGRISPWFSPSGCGQVHCERTNPDDYPRRGCSRLALRNSIRSRIDFTPTDRLAISGSLHLLRWECVCWNGGRVREEWIFLSFFFYRRGCNHLFGAGGLLADTWALSHWVPLVLTQGCRRKSMLTSCLCPYYLILFLLSIPYRRSPFRSPRVVPSRGAQWFFPCNGSVFSPLQTCGQGCQWIYMHVPKGQ